MKNIALISFMALALFAVSGCASKGSIQTNYDENQNFSAYKTFSWVDGPAIKHAGDRPISTTGEQTIAAAVRNTLIEKGYQFVDDVSEADFAVSFTVGIRDEIEILDKAPLVAAGDTWSYVGYGTDIYAHEYHEGSLAIDIFDAERRVTVWHGAGAKELSESNIGPLDGIKPAVEDILATFPPQ